MPPVQLLPYVSLITRKVFGFHWRQIWKHQIYSILLSFITGLSCYQLMDTDPIDYPKLVLIFALLLTATMKFFVAFFCRAELYSHLSTKLFKSISIGYNVYKFVYVLWFVCVIHQTILITFLSSNTLEINSILSIILTIIFTGSSILIICKTYKQNCIWNYIGRYYFYPQQFISSQIISKKLNQCIFSLLFLYIPGILGQSRNALLIAFNYHLGTIIHYYCTELTDLQYIIHIHNLKSNTDRDLIV
eukprot:412104_1